MIFLRLNAPIKCSNKTISPFELWQKKAAIFFRLSHLGSPIENLHSLFQQRQIELSNRRSLLNISSTLTSERTLHCRLHQPREQLQRLGVLRQPVGERTQGLGVPAQTLKGNSLAVIGLEIRSGKKRSQSLTMERLRQIIVVRGR